MGELYDKLCKGWSFVDLEPIKKGEDTIDRRAVPYINTSKAWNQYNNPLIYEGDKAIRQFITEMHETNPKWDRKHCDRKFTFGMLYKILFGTEWKTEKGCANIYTLKKLFAYYSTRIQKIYYKDGKQKNKPAYTLMANIEKKPPYSLKLRVEWLVRQGKIPNGYNMKLPKDNLTIGHARNPRTDANMEFRRERARERYNEYKRERKLNQENNAQQATESND